MLGVLDIRYSLDDMDQRIRRNALTITGFSLGFVLIASLSVGLFVHRLVYLPLRDLESGARRISSGDLEQPIPVRSGDEFGELADAFNAMTAALRNSRSELREWARTLEQKVEQRTEQLRIAQAEAARGEKLASVGLLASGIAHELNNPLTGVLTFSILLREKMADGSQDAEDMDLVIRETRRCASIIRRLLDFAREKPPEKKFADLNQIIEDTVRLVERPANLRDIAITLELDRALPQVWVDPDQIKQVVMNLLVNAQHAIDEEGSITVRTRRLPQPRTLQPGAIAVPMVEFSVTDTGCGIPEENFRRIFDPFFTTKKIGTGTGLGLSVSHGIVEAHGGTIEVESEVGKGSTFRVRLPLIAVARSRGKRKQREHFVSAKILIVDDEQIIIDSCLRILRNEDYQLEAVQDGLEALRKIDENHYDIVILDIMMPKIDGLEVLRRVREGHPDIDVIMITGLSQIETAVKSMKLGAFDYLPKPFDPDELKLVVHRALERRRLLAENLNLKTEVGAKYRFDNVIGASPQMQSVYRLVAKCAPTNSTVMLTGESGTGKELIARAIHYNSLRKDKPFIPVDCNALSETLLESELFGHVKGAFTGAVANKKGMLEIADGGTLFLDEIGNISLTTQAKLLRVIQEREFRAVGDTRTQAANFRLITATNKDLKAMVADGRFREDLFYRINIFPIRVPPLRERRDDIPALAFHFLGVFSAELGKKVTEFSEEAMAVLMNYDWPGNVRELENTVQRAVILATDARHSPGASGAYRRGVAGASPSTSREPAEELKQIKKLAREKSVENIEKLFVLDALKRNAWNATRSAEETGMQRANFQALMKKYNIRIRESERDPDEADAP